VFGVGEDISSWIIQEIPSKYVVSAFLVVEFDRPVETALARARERCSDGARRGTLGERKAVSCKL